jgi:hypothetical protein
MPELNQRWGSDGSNIRCCNGERVQVALALVCHDRKAIEVVTKPMGPASSRPITAPAYSPDHHSEYKEP